VARLQELDALLKLAGKSGNVVLLPNLADLLVPPPRRGEIAMNLPSFFASLFRTRTGGRSPPPRPRQAGGFPFEADWANLLARLGLPPSALRDVVEADSLHPHFTTGTSASPRETAAGARSPRRTSS